MNAWWFSLLLLTIAAALLNSRQTLRLYFVAQLVNALAVFVFSNWLTDWYLAAYIVTTVPIIECCIFLLWDTGLTNRQLAVAFNFGLFMGAVGAYYAGNWNVGNYVTFAEGLLLAIIGMAMALVTVGKREWAKIRTIGALCLILSWYDFAFVRGWQGSNNWLPTAICAAMFGWIGFRRVSSVVTAR